MNIATAKLITDIPSDWNRLRVMGQGSAHVISKAYRCVLAFEKDNAQIYIASYVSNADKDFFADVYVDGYWVGSYFEIKDALVAIGAKNRSVQS